MQSDEEWSPRYNIAPTQSVPVVRQHPKESRRDLSLIRWGLIPSWAADPSIGWQMINVRSETAASKRAFCQALELRRCLVPADGFYEWKRAKASKQPYCFEVGDRELFAFAGVWDRWKDPSGQWIRTFSILTTTANAVTSSVHERMPVILEREDYDFWLDPGMKNIEAVSELLKPHRAHTMRCYPVSSRVNSVTNDDEQCSAPMEIADTEIQPGLF